MKKLLILFATLTLVCNSVQVPETLDQAPFSNETTPVDVSFAISIQSMDIDVNGVLSIHAWITLQWNDPRLTWNPIARHNATTIRLPPSQVWTPDISMYNSFGSPVPARKNRILGLSSDLVVSSDGNVLFVDSQDFKFRCPQYFEPDRQSIWEPFNCTMKFGSWTHNGWELNLVAKSSEADTGAYNAASSISVLFNKISRNQVLYSCCPEPYIDLDVDMGLQRVYRINPNDGTIIRNPLMSKV